MSGELWIGPRGDPDRFHLSPAVARGAEGLLYRGHADVDGRSVELAVKMLQPGHLDRIEEWNHPLA